MARASRRAGETKTRPRSAAISAGVQADLRRRVEEHARRKWPALRVEIVVRFRGQFAYVGYREQSSGSRARGEDLDPTPLYRLGFTRDRRRWSYALFTWSNESYTPSLGASGSFTATPEQAFDSAANLYLG